MLDQLENAATHDDVWNSAQASLLTEGHIQNRLRMLWGKKILEWSPSPEEALHRMIHLNNKYALDGRDPNSYNGIFWILGPLRQALGPGTADFRPRPIHEFQEHGKEAPRLTLTSLPGIILAPLRGAVGVERTTPGVACAPPGANLLPALRAGPLHAGLVFSPPGWSLARRRRARMVARGVRAIASHPGSATIPNPHPGTGARTISQSPPAIIFPV
jgi:hypothetical protein